jgi:hypothetical protein
MITASSSAGGYCFLIIAVKCFAISGSMPTPSISLEQTALATSCSIIKVRGSMESLGTTSLEKRGPKLAVKWDIVRRAEDTEMPTESFNAMLGISEKTTVLRLWLVANLTKQEFACAPNARLTQSRDAKVIVQNFDVWKLGTKIFDLQIIYGNDDASFSLWRWPTGDP